MTATYIVHINEYYNYVIWQLCSQGQFQLAMQLVGREFIERVLWYKNIWLPARAVVQRALESRFQVNIYI